MRLWGTILAALALPAGAAWADTVSQAPDAVAVTLYHDDGLTTSQLLHPEPGLLDEGLAVITETRQIDLPAGPSQIRFRGVASTMVPQTAVIDGLPAGALERNFDYDLLSPGSLLAKSIGETVHLIRTDPKTGKRIEQTAIVRSGPNGAMLEIDGKFEALRCSGLPETLVFDRTPDGLSDTPTLAVRTDVPVAGHYTVKLTYLATGLNWSADYVARVHGQTLDLSGWLTLANFGSTGFVRAPIAALAGRINTTGDDTPIHAPVIALATACWPTDIDWASYERAIELARAYPAPPPPPPPPPAAMLETVVVTAERKAEQRQLGDYKLYELPEPTDMPAHETKQVLFLDQHDVPFERIYRYRITDGGQSDGNPTTLVLRLQNTEQAGLGKPLPTGEMAITEPGPGGAPIFIGQRPIHDTPVGLPIEIENGEVFSVQVNQTLAAETPTDKGDRVQRSYDLRVANNRASAVAVELWQGLRDGQAKIVSESAPHVAERGAAIWRIALKPGERVEMHFAIDEPH